MKFHLRLAVLLGLAVVFLSGLSLRSQEPADTDDSSQAEPLMSGPCHEAFAQPGAASPEPPPGVDKQPPEPINEEVPDEKPEGDNVQWIPGYWDYDSDRQDYVWVTGLWRVCPPDHQWVATYWTEASGKWRRVPGFWSPCSGESEEQDLSYNPKPPPDQDEDPGEAPEPGCDFVPGCWESGSAGYIWRPGLWIHHRPGWLWKRPLFLWTPGGWLRVRGFWDHALSRRGVPYAPLRIPLKHRGPRFRLRPRHALPTHLLGKSLLRNPGGRGFRIKNVQHVKITQIPGVKAVRVTPQQRVDLAKRASDLRKVAQQRQGQERLASKSPRRTPTRVKLNLPRPPQAKGGERRFIPPPHPTPVRLAKKTGSPDRKPPTPGGKTPVAPGGKTPPALVGKKPGTPSPDPGFKRPGLRKPPRRPDPPRPVVKRPAPKSPPRKPIVKRPVGARPPTPRPTTPKLPHRPAALRPPVRRPATVSRPPVRRPAPKPPARPTRKH